MAEELKTIKFQMMLSESEAKAIDDWSFANRIRSRAEAIRRLCSMALYVDPVFSNLMVELTTAVFPVKSEEEAQEIKEAAAEAHAAWSLLRKGDSLEQGMEAFELAKVLLKIKREQEK